jgi:hypothetical protein
MGEKKNQILDSSSLEDKNLGEPPEARVAARDDKPHSMMTRGTGVEGNHDAGFILDSRVSARE